jgi:hypothetical protein
MDNQLKRPKTRIRKLVFESLEARVCMSAEPSLFYLDFTVTHYEISGFNPTNPPIWQSKHLIRGKDAFDIEETHQHISDYYSSNGEYAGKPNGQSELSFSGRLDHERRKFFVDLEYKLLQSFSSELNPLWGSETGVKIEGKLYARVAGDTKISSTINYIYDTVEDDTVEEAQILRLSGHGTLSPLWGHSSGNWGPPNSANTYTSRNYGNSTLTQIEGNYYRSIASLGFYSYIFGGDSVWHSPPSSYLGALSYTAEVEIAVEDKKPVPKAEFPSSIGLGKTVTFSGTASIDPDNIEGSEGIVRYEWFSRKRGGITEQRLGVGSTIEYKPSDFGIYDILLIVTDDEGNQVAKEYPLTVNLLFLNVIEHGWAPFKSNLATTQINFDAYRLSLLEHARPYLDGLPESQFRSTSLPWDSRRGFNEAFAFALLYETLDALPSKIGIDILTKFALQNAALHMQQLFHIESEREARIAAIKVAGYVSDEVEKIKFDRRQSYAVNLIGHSRGGYVVSLASKMLRQFYGLDVCTVTTLDGFGEDWPSIAAMIADGSIVETATADKRNNYRVQDSLFYMALAPDDEFSTSMASWLNSALSVAGLSYRVDPDSVRKLTDWIIEKKTDFRAPSRPFESNDVIFDPNDKVRSNHVNVHELYFAKDQPLLNDSPWVKPQSCTSLFRQDYGGESAGEMSLLDYPNFQLLSQGSLNLLRNIQKTTKSNGPVLDGLASSFDSWLDSLILLSASNGWIEKSLLNGMNVALKDIGAETGLNFSSVGSVRIPVELVDGNNWLTLRLDKNALGSNSSLSIRVGNKTIFNQSGTALLTQPEIIKIAFTSDQTANYVNVSGSWLTLMHLSIAAGEDSYGLFARNPVVFEGDPTDLVVESFAGSDSVQRQVDLYRESNNQPGLQFGQGGDELLVSREWDKGSSISIQVPSLERSNDGAKVYAIVKYTEHLFATNTVDLVFAEEDMRWLTNKSNRHDVTRDFVVSPLDALVILNRLNQRGPSSVMVYDTNALLLDVNADGFVNAIDAINVINYLGRRVLSSVEGESDDMTSAIQFSSATDMEVISSYASWLVWAVEDSAVDLLGFPKKRRR